MDLSTLTLECFKLFEAKENELLSEKIMETVKNNDFNKYEQFVSLVEDLSIDWLQQIYQFYYADREGLKQDYTPRSLCRLLHALAGDTEKSIDICSGTGALTIQRWNQNKNIEIECYELDKKVLPLLIFNMAIRNIKGKVYHSNVLTREIYATYELTPTEKYSRVEIL